MSDIEDQLRRVPLFAAMTDAAIAAIAARTEEAAFPAGERLTVEGEAGESFIVLLDGAADVMRGATTVRRLGPGDFMGEISLIDGRPRTATVTLTAPARALVVRRPQFLELIDRFPSVRLGVLMALTERIRNDATTASD